MLTSKCFTTSISTASHAPAQSIAAALRSKQVQRLSVQSASSSTFRQARGVAQALGPAFVLGWQAALRRKRQNRGTAFAAAADGYSEADQVQRTAALKKAKVPRYLNIEDVYKPASFKGKRVLLVGGNRGLGFELVKALVDAGADTITTTRKSSTALDELAGQKGVSLLVLEGADMQDLASIRTMVSQIDKPLDYVIHSAGYFMEEKETLKSLDFSEEIKQIDICALAPLRVVSELYKASKLKETKVAIISSQAGSAAWRTTQNKDEGGDYGHHMSRAACNMAGVLMSEELKGDKIPVVLLHPGFNRTEMTAKYSDIWDIEGAVEPAIGAKRVLHEVSMISMDTTGKFINCEDGLRIPW